MKAATKALEVEYENFEYADMDSLENEINEFYSISETAVFYEAQKYFKSKYPGGNISINQLINSFTKIFKKNKTI